MMPVSAYPPSNTVAPAHADDIATPAVAPHPQLDQSAGARESRSRSMADDRGQRGRRRVI